MCVWVDGWASGWEGQLCLGVVVCGRTRNLSSLKHPHTTWMVLPISVNPPSLLGTPAPSKIWGGGSFQGRKSAMVVPAHIMWYTHHMTPSYHDAPLVMVHPIRPSEQKTNINRYVVGKRHVTLHSSGLSILYTLGASSLWC